MFMWWKDNACMHQLIPCIRHEVRHNVVTYHYSVISNEKISCVRVDRSGDIYESISSHGLKMRHTDPQHWRICYIYWKILSSCQWWDEYSWYDLCVNTLFSWYQYWIVICAYYLMSWRCGLVSGVHCFHISQAGSMHGSNNKLHQTWREVCMLCSPVIIQLKETTKYYVRIVDRSGDLYESIPHCGLTMRYTHHIHWVIHHMKYVPLPTADIVNSPPFIL